MRDKTNVPTAFALFLKNMAKPSHAYAERFFNVQRYTELPAGGHSAACEQPTKLADDLRAFAREQGMFGRL